MAGGRGKRKSTAALQHEAVKKAKIKYDPTANDALLANWMGKHIREEDIHDTSNYEDNESVSDDDKERFEETARGLRQIYQPDTKMCNTCHTNPTTAVIKTHTGFDNSRKSTATTCRQCAEKDTSNDYVQDAACCGHGMERYYKCLECKICVGGRQTNNIVNSGGVCRECKVDLSLDNMHMTHGRICIGCSKKERIARQEIYKISVECDDCGGTYQKRGSEIETVKKYKLCDNFFKEVGLPCKLICPQEIVIDGMKMRCRSKRHIHKATNKLESPWCGQNKCQSFSYGKSKKTKGVEFWFVCKDVQNDRKTPESLPMFEETAIVSSENDQDDRKMAAV